MRRKEASIGFTLVLAMAAMAMLTTSTRAAAQTETVLRSFNGLDGRTPEAGLIFDAAGNLYGTTEGGGAYGDGAVFKLSPNGSGGWTEKVVHSFNNNGKDGYWPYASLIFDGSGNLYGTTYAGGSHGQGTVFELTPHGSGPWSERLLHSFNNNGTDGYAPYGNLVFDAAGNLYGTTYYGGTLSNGTVFELIPVTGGGWKEKILLKFNGGNGERPANGLIFDGAGNLYGTASNGGASGHGTVFELKPAAGGSWTSAVLLNFDNYGGAYPTGALVLDAAGNLYGTTGGGGLGFGNVFELTPSGSGSWTETVLLEFNGGSQGGYPGTGLLFDAAGNLYGTCNIGGANNKGTVFELAPAVGGGWNEMVLYSFYTLSSGTDGWAPVAGLIRDAAGHLYGTTTQGGTDGDGTVFEVTP